MTGEDELKSGLKQQLLDQGLECCSHSTGTLKDSRSGPSCSKLTMSLVNDSLKFTSSDTQIS